MILELKNLEFEYIAGTSIFHDVSFSLEKGETLSILGANGAGKSTLLNCIAGLYKPKSGDILIEGKSLLGMSQAEAAKLIGYVPQIHGQIFDFSVLDFTVMGRTPYIGAFASPSKEDFKIAERSLERIGISHLKNKIFTEMSGGEQQMVMLARALTQETDIILMDEPTNHLDYGNQYRIVDMMRQLKDEGYTVITTTHNPDHALMIGGKVAILDEHGELHVGPSAEQLNSESLSQLYHLQIGVSYNDEAKRNICYVKK